MNINLTCLRDPFDGGELSISSDALSSANGNRYPNINKIPRFVDLSNYSDDFGYQWNKFSKTQLDSQVGIDLSEKRLERCLGLELSSLKGKLVLEAGSGAGRFTEILLKYGAIVHSFDYSSAVEANARNNGESENLTLVQADIRFIPYAKNNYDIVCCLGVLQHTPSTESSISHLWQMVKPGGILVFDHYPWSWRKIIYLITGPANALLRQYVLRLPKSSRFNFVKTVTDFYFPFHWKYRDNKILQRLLRIVSPITFHYPGIKLPNEETYYEWALLDTHDSTTDVFKRYRTRRSISNTLRNLGAVNIKVCYGYNGVEAFCRKPVNPPMI
jgi:2-polyprenyl-3-methyl-5-hydroxy-6-metoxy-1,4-benzoquinol methylase